MDTWLIAFLIMGFIVGGILIWGIAGGVETQDPGVTCDVGMGDALCWQWHTNAYGQVGEFLNNIGGN